MLTKIITSNVCTTLHGTKVRRLGAHLFLFLRSISATKQHEYISASCQTEGITFAQLPNEKFDSLFHLKYLCLCTVLKVREKDQSIFIMCHCAIWKSKLLLSFCQFNIRVVLLIFNTVLSNNLQYNRNIRNFS